MNFYFNFSLFILKVNHFWLFSCYHCSFYFDYKFLFILSDDNCLSGDELDKVLDSNDEEFSLFEPGSKDFLKDIPEGSAESIALSLLGKFYFLF